MTISKITQSELTGQSPTDIVFFKHIYAVPVWNIEQTTVAYWILMCYKLQPHGCIGTVKHLDYILNASKTKI